MDPFDDTLFLAKEWLVKVDTLTSTPYLIKFHASPVELTCAVMVTDTKRTWAEGLSSKQFARRWRECNNRSDSPPLDDEEEDAWRARSLEFLSSAHTLGGMPELSFEVIECKFGDFSIQLECDAFKWRWETFFVGHKTSADILSKHLIMPLISLSHLAFSSLDVVGDLPPADLEKTIDKVARTARRASDVHVKNALSKPRPATTIRRITAAFNFVPDAPPVLTELNSPALIPSLKPMPKMKRPPERLETTRGYTPEPRANRHDISVVPERESVGLSGTPGQINHARNSGSATEPEDDPPAKSSKPAPGPGADQRPDVRMRSPTLSKEVGGRSRNVTKAPPSDTDSSPARPVKKSKPRASSPDEDSEEERKKLVAQIKSGAASAPGFRQPVRRGGKRF